MGGGITDNPDYGLEALKAGIDAAKQSVISGKAKVASALTSKGVNTAAEAAFDTMAANIGQITTLSQGTQDATAGAEQILSGYTAYAEGGRVTGTIPSQGAQTITPGTSAQTIAAGRYLSGQQTIAGDASLIPANIAKGKSIFGVAGSLEASMDFTAQCSDHTYQKSCKLARFEPFTVTGSISTPAGTQEVTLTFNNYKNNESYMFFKPPDGVSVTNVAAIKYIAYSRGGYYVYFRGEHSFSWNNPLIKQGFTPPGGGTGILDGKNKLALYFPQAAPNGEYGGMTVNYVDAYYY
ncbi:hypothetical protein D7V96_23495 [bacterium D16-59]|nr:hypothetical protein D7V96_23495 [bacterium D16-59]